MVVWYGMNLRIDKAGRIVLPKPIRTQLGLTADTELEVVRSGDGILLRPAQQRATMQDCDGLWVHVGTAEANADWRQAIDGARAERLDAVSKA